jgi:hypothetical protein
MRALAFTQAFDDFSDDFSGGFDFVSRCLFAQGKANG